MHCFVDEQLSPLWQRNRREADRSVSERRWVLPEPISMILEFEVDAFLFSASIDQSGIRPNDERTRKENI